jgi:hypothetical protein
MPTSAGPNSKGENSLVFAFDMADTQNSNLGLPVHNVIRPLNEWRLRRIQIEELPKGSYNSPIRNARIWKCRYDINNTVHSNPLTRDAGEGYYPGANPLILPDTVWRGESLYYYSMWVRGFNTNAPDASVSMDLNDRNGASASVSDEVWRKLEVYNTNSHELTHFDFHDLYPNKGSKDSIDFLVTGLMLCRTEGNEYADLGSITTPPAWLPEGSIRSNAAINPVDKTPLSLNVSYTSDKTFEFDGTDDFINTGITSENWAEETFTLEAVVKYNRTNNHSWFEMSRPDSSTSGFISVTRTNYFYFYWIGPYGGNGHAVNSSLIVPDEYIHIAITFNGVGGNDQEVLYNNTTVYLNGVNSPHESLGSAAISAGGELYFGANQYKMNGEVPLFKYYNRELSAEEVSANFEVIRKRFNI